VTQHATLSAERWAAFSLDQQVLMIANEMQRASGLFAPDRDGSLRLAYERVLRLLDLTVEVQRKPTLRRELLRWRDLVAALYVAPLPDPGDHRAAFRCLLRMRPEASRQIPYLLG
jgi:hypothetical protein